MLHGALSVRDRSWFPPAAALVTMTLVSTALLGGLGYGVADQLIHPPRDLPRVTPNDRGLPYEQVRFATEDGVTLVGWWMPALVEDPAGTVIFLHGYGASKAQSLAVAPFLHNADYHVLAFDFRAHGASGGTYTTVGLEEVKDVRAAIRFLRAQPTVDMDRIAVIGWSMGGATAIHAARELPEVKAFVVDSVFARLENVVSHSLPAFTGLPHHPFGTLGILFASWMVHRSVWENQPARAIEEFERPILIIQGLQDDIARPEVDAAALHHAAGGAAQLWLVPDATHVNARRADPQAYEQNVLSFLAEHLNEPEAARGEGS